MAVLSADPRSREQWREVGRLVAAGIGWLLFAAGWLVARSLRAVGTAVAAVLFGVGWLGSAVAWPALRWCARAVRLGWQSGSVPIGGRRGPA